MGKENKMGLSHNLDWVWEMALAFVDALLCTFLGLVGGRVKGGGTSALMSRLIRIGI